MSNKNYIDFKNTYSVSRLSLFRHVMMRLNLFNILIYPSIKICAGSISCYRVKNYSKDKFICPDCRRNGYG